MGSTVRASLRSSVAHSVHSLRCLRRPGRVEPTAPSIPTRRWPAVRSGAPALPQVARASLALGHAAHGFAVRSGRVAPRAPGRMAAGRPAGSEQRKRASASRPSRPSEARGDEAYRRARAGRCGDTVLARNHHARTLGETGNRVGLKGAARLDPVRRKQAPQRATRARSAATPGRSGERSEPEVVRACSDGSRAGGGFRGGSGPVVVVAAIGSTGTVAGRFHRPPTLIGSSGKTCQF